MKPLFIPVKTEYFIKMKAGEKPYEIRKYGGPWTEKNCVVGRPVVISKGYGKSDRFNGKISQFARCHIDEMSSEAQAAARAVYGPGVDYFAVIWFIKC